MVMILPHLMNLNYRKQRNKEGNNCSDAFQHIFIVTASLSSSSLSKLIPYQEH